MIRIFFRKRGGLRVRQLAVSEIRTALRQPEGVLWVSLEQPTAEEIQTVLADIFQFHPLTIEDATTPRYHPPKLDLFDDYIFIVAHALRPEPLAGGLDVELDTVQLNFFLGQNYMVTTHIAEHMPSIQTLRERMSHNSRLLDRGPDFLCHSLLDYLVDEYLPLLDQVDEELEQIEDEIFEQPDPALLQRILSLKHSLLILRRIVSPQREVMNRLSRGELPQIATENEIYFRDIYDHLVRLHDLSEATRDVISGTLEAYLSMTSNRLNEIMKILAIISTIFLPLSFLAGVYGMNFQYMPLLDWSHGFTLVWLVFGAIGLGMLYYFKRQGWF